MSGSQKTQINPMGAATSINPSVKAEYNSSRETELNTAVLGQDTAIPAGTLLAGQYRVENILSQGSGEAILYLCQKGGKEYVAKVYRRKNAVKKDVLEALHRIHSPYVAQIYASQSWNGYPYEILPYYKNGSLEGKTFSLDQLTHTIIPKLNEGLKALHDAQIIHKDLKPSNIMMGDDGKTLSIIDFGISSVREGGRTVLVTQTGMTPDYSAPETYHNLFLAESDYYSLGITLYELYCGHTPYDHLTPDLLEKYLAIQRVPFPKNFPASLQELILGLTYPDITNRKDKKNPNRRWTYEEVKAWCAGEKVPVPGSPSASETAASNQTIPPITFMYHRYTNLEQLVQALGSDWNNGKKRLYRSNLSSYFQKIGSDLANVCLDAEEAFQKDPMKEDVEYFKVLYGLNPAMKDFYWMSNHFETMEQLGDKLFEVLRTGKSDEINRFGFMASENLFSIREGIVNRNHGDTVQKLHALETEYQIGEKEKNQRKKVISLYLLAYYYRKDRGFITSFGKFSNFLSLLQWFKEQFRNGQKQLDIQAGELMKTADNPEAGKKKILPTDYFAAWLILQGKGQYLTKEEGLN